MRFPWDETKFVAERILRTVIIKGQNVIMRKLLEIETSVESGQVGITRISEVPLLKLDVPHVPTVCTCSYTFVKTYS